MARRKSDTVNDVTQDLNEYSDKPIAQSKALQTQPKSEAKSEFFGNPIYLTVSGQFHLEACALALGDVYTLNSAFRAETGTSKKHLSLVNNMVPNVQLTLQKVLIGLKMFIRV